jgi:TRAP-type transport system large permease protein
VAAILIPMMRPAGYNVPRAAGLMAAGGVIAPVIPPSIAFIIFGVAANVSITGLFMGGIVPGLIMALALVGAWMLVSRRESVEPLPRRSGRERLSATVKAGWALMMPVIILGGIRFGIFTPTEAAVVAAVYALFVGLFVYRELKLADLYGVFVNAAKLSAVIMFLVAAAMVSAWLITIAEIPSQLVGLLQPFLDNKTLLMLVIMALVFAVGTAMDMTPTILILTPVLMPVIKAAGIDPVYFGVLFIINNSIGLITPPVGTVLNTVAGVGRMKLDDVMRGSLPFLLAEVAVLLLMVLFPPLVTVPARWLSG